MEASRRLTDQPDAAGYFGPYGGRLVPEPLAGILEEITGSYLEIRDDPEFRSELSRLGRHFAGRPTPIHFAANLSARLGGARIYLKREDLAHTGAHKINHCLGEALLARRMGRRRLIAETGAGQHGVALAAAAALTGLECDIYMGTVDIAKQRPNVQRMKILGARVLPVSAGAGTLKEAVDAAIEAFAADPLTRFYAIGSVVGPHPFPMMVRDFQRVIGDEAREQFQELAGALPDNLVACVGGGSNAIGLFSAFLDDEHVRMFGVEPAGRGTGDGDHAATLTLGRPGEIHGFRCYLLQDRTGAPLPVHTIASGLDYPGVGPQHSLLKDICRVSYKTVGDREAVDAFFMLSRTEGIIPALESAHAVAFAVRLARLLGAGRTILVNLSGRGDKDLDFVMSEYGAAYRLE